MVFMSNKEGDIKRTLKNVNICLTLVVENRDLLYYVLYFCACFIFLMKCFIIFLLRKEKQRRVKDDRQTKQ